MDIPDCKEYVVTEADAKNCNPTEKDVPDHIKKQGDVKDVLKLATVYNKGMLLNKYIKYRNKFPKEVEPIAKKLANVVLIFGLPNVSASKVGKLHQLVSIKVGEMLLKKLLLEPSEYLITMELCGDTTDQEAKVAVIGTISTNTSALAELVGIELDGFLLNKFTLCAVYAEDVKTLQEMHWAQENDDEEYEGSELPQVVEKKAAVNLNFLQPKDLTDWLYDDAGREQFFLSNSTYSDLQLFWNSPVQMESTPIQESIRCNYGIWSPRGSFLITRHKKGLKIRGNSDLQEISSVVFEKTDEFLMSPNERYILCSDGSSMMSHGITAKATSYAIFDVWTGRKVKNIPPPNTPHEGDLNEPFQWSYDSKFLLINNRNSVWILKAPEFDTLLFNEKKIYQIKYRHRLGTVKISPAKNHVAVWSYGDGDSLCTFKLIDLERQDTICTRVYNMECESALMMWHPQGNFFCLQITAYKKVTRKARQKYTQLDVYHTLLKGCPNDSFVLDQENNKDIYDVQFEPNGDMLAVLSQDSLWMYRLKRTASDAKSKCIIEHALPPTLQLDSVHWSPQGKFFVLGNTIPDHGGDGTLSFCSTQYNEKKDEWKIDESHQDAHRASNNIMWDSSGRYVASCVMPLHDGDHKNASQSGFKIWTFQGGLIYEKRNMKVKVFDDEKNEHIIKEVPIEGFVWRPHPPPSLTPERLADIKTNVESYAAKYNTSDASVRDAAMNVFQSKKKELIKAFEDKMTELSQLTKTHPFYGEWNRLRQEYGKDDAYVEMRETIEGKTTKESILIEEKST